MWRTDLPVVPAAAIRPADAATAPDAAGRVGRIAWLDLTVADATTTRDFYRDVIGWSVDDVPMKDAGDQYADYLMLGADGEPAAGVCHARGTNLSLSAIQDPAGACLALTPA